MRYRRLRIAWSVAGGIACVLLIALWVRSYWWIDYIGRVDIEGKDTTIGSNQGAVYWATISPAFGNETILGWHHGSIDKATLPHYYEVWHWEWSPKEAALPHWFVVVLSLVTATLPWLRWRFSLRTLLIATTLIAVVLGLIVAGTRWQAG